jgi:hypothetical protein
MRGLLKQHGVDILGIPLSLSSDLADQVLRDHMLHRKLARLGLFAAMADYQQSLELTATQVAWLLFTKNRRDCTLSTCHRVKAIFDKHGIETPPILVDQNNRVIG